MRVRWPALYLEVKYLKWVSDSSRLFVVANATRIPSFGSLLKSSVRKACRLLMSIGAWFVLRFYTRSMDFFGNKLFNSSEKILSLSVLSRSGVEHNLSALRKMALINPCFCFADEWQERKFRFPCYFNLIAIVCAFDIIVKPFLVNNPSLH